SARRAGRPRRARRHSQRGGRRGEPGRARRGDLARRAAFPDGAGGAARSRRRCELERRRRFFELDERRAGPFRRLMDSRLTAAELGAAADPVIIALACAGDARAFTELVRRRHARVRKLMYHLCGQPSDGDDLAQQVFINVWRSLPQLRAAAAFDGWLRRIMITTWLEEARKRRVDATTAVDIESAAATNDSTAERLDLDAALAQLPDEARLCIVLADS